MNVFYAKICQLSFFGMILLAAGCSSKSPYPKAWSPIDGNLTSSCADIGGFYRNVGTEIEGKYVKKTKLQYFLYYGRPPQEIGEIEVSHIGMGWDGGDQINVEFWAGETLLYHSTFPCANGIPYRDSWIGTGFGAFGASKLKYQFHKAADGALVISTGRNTRAISIFVVPVLLNEKWWTLFEPWPAPKE